MYTQFSLSLLSSNYIFKIRLDNIAINFFNKEKLKIEKHVQALDVNVIRDEYEGEVLGYAFNNVEKDFMLKEMNRWMKFFESQGLEVYEAKITTLKDRLKELEKLTERNKIKLKEIK